MDGHFLVRQVYEDAKTYDLVGAASKVLSECKLAKFWKAFEFIKSIRYLPFHLLSLKADPLFDKHMYVSGLQFKLHIIYLFLFIKIYQQQISYSTSEKCSSSFVRNQVMTKFYKF